MLINQKNEKHYYDKTAVKEDKVFKEGDEVWVQDVLSKTRNGGTVCFK